MTEKTEKPTPKRLRDAREKGQVAKSKEIATCAVIISLFGYIWLFFDYYLERLKYLLQLPAHYYKLPFDQALSAIGRIGFQEFCVLTLPLAIAALTIAAASFLAQVGFLVTFQPVVPDFNKINPVGGIKRIFSLNTFLELLKSILKIVLLTAIVYLLVKDNIKNMINTAYGSAQTVLDITSSILKKLTLAASALFIVVAVIDYFFQKYLHIKNLKMSKQDIKREYKDREGDPYLKNRRRNLLVQLTADDMVGKLKLSTVILTESKKLALAVYYEMGKTPLPIVTVKGKNLMAEKIVEVAKGFRKPIFTDAHLTRQLYANCEKGSYITGKYIQPVGVVLRGVMQAGTMQR